MKKVIMLALSIGISGLYACQSQENETNSYEPIELDAKSASVVKANNQFGLNLLNELSTKTQGNLFISPLSVSQALSMTWNGASGETANEMATTLGYQYNNAEINTSSKTIKDALLGADEKVELTIANSIWSNKDYSIATEFAKTIDTYYDAQTETFDVNKAEESIAKINGWVNDQTRGKIPTVIEKIDVDNMMFLINAIYFKGKWKYNFKKEETTDQPFYNITGSTSQTKMMHQQTNLGYTANEQYQAVELPYGNGHFSMVVILPQEGVCVNKIASEITAEGWQNLTESLTEQSINLYLPKFKVENKIKLNETLQSLGINRAFTDVAEFPNMITGVSLCISEVIHKTYIEVSEEGTEAAAVTSVSMVVTSIGGDDPIVKEFNVNRPFIFAIKEKDTGSIIFAGKITTL